MVQESSVTSVEASTATGPGTLSAPTEETVGAKGASDDQVVQHLATSEVSSVYTHAILRQNRLEKSFVAWRFFFSFFL